ncbi:MAG: hypothetical protein M1834_007889 [Cirrosporium novae-zelandiae]|nr:MAG: hypothetical protein M1834_007889 [Cirrosporium novae-zelandiae]
MFLWVTLFMFWRMAELVTLIPIVGMLAYFVNIYVNASRLTPNAILVLFIVSVLAAAWALATVIRLQSSRRSAHFVAFIDLCFVGAFIGSVYELRRIANAHCPNFGNNGFYIALGIFSVNPNKECGMLKACFAFGIMNCIFFFASAILAYLMKIHEHDVVIRETYTTRRRSHGSRRGHSASGSHRRSHSSSRRYYV